MKRNSINLATIWLALLLVTALTFAPVLGPMAQAGSINYNGVSSVTVEDEYGMQQPMGLMFNFSFGGPKDYKKNKSVQDIQKANMDADKIGAYATLITGIGITILIVSQ